MDFLAWILIGVGIGWVLWNRGREGQEAPPPAAVPIGSRVLHVTEIVPYVDDPDLDDEEGDDPEPVLVQATPRAGGTAAGTLVAEAPIVVGHVVTAHWQERGWKPNGNRLEGYYRTPLGSCQGYIDAWQSGEPKFYLLNPPPELAKHPHAVCFRPRGGGLYWVHFATAPTSADVGILAIETVLMESLVRSRRNT